MTKNDEVNRKVLIPKVLPKNTTIEEEKSEETTEETDWDLSWDRSRLHTLVETWFSTKIENFYLDGAFRKSNDRRVWYVGGEVGEGRYSVTAGRYPDLKGQYFGPRMERLNSLQQGVVKAHQKKAQNKVEEEINKGLTQRKKDLPKIWKNAGNCIGNEYLALKDMAQIACELDAARVVQAAYYTESMKKYKISPGTLLIPIYDDEEKLVSFQRIIHINNEFKKLNLAGKLPWGYHFRIPGKDGVVYIAEGFVTALTIRMLTEYQVYGSVAANNLKNVLELVLRRHPDCEIIIAADNDESNTGLKEAMLAARGKGKCKSCSPNARWNGL